MGDFETTVYEGQETTEVWASALVELGTEDVHIFGSIGETYLYLTDLKENCIVYYHNLKFDGEFWIYYLLNVLKFEQAIEEKEWIPNEKMRNQSFKYLISTKGMFYTITFKVHDKTIELRDSLKLLPFSVKRIGESFKTKHKKLEIEYKGKRYAGCYISPIEKEYIKNDVLVVKEALELMFSQGHDKLTIGACCLSEYKKTGAYDYEEIMPDLTQVSLDPQIYTYDNADAYIRRSYKGGWCYLVRGKENRIFHNGSTVDVNSLYPSMMSSESGNIYPVGKPVFWTGNYIPDEALKKDRYFFVRVRTRFEIKRGRLPFIQIKGNPLYKGTEALETSDVKDLKTGKYSRYLIGFDGELEDTRVTLTLTMTDYKLMVEHYNLSEFEILDGCWFFGLCGIFDEYINKYKKIKQESTGAQRELAKLFLNNLYGKMASSTDSSFKLAIQKEDGSVGYVPVIEHNKTAGFIAIGSAITSYARNFTIRSAQKNFHGIDKPGFIYADTDSIHCDLPPEEIKGVKLDNKEFCCWKIESEWDTAVFARQKTYIEHVVKRDSKPVEKPYYDIKCAGMPQKCKDLFNLSITTQEPEKGVKYTKEELEFIRTKRTLSDFKIGLLVPGKLMPKRIKGGIVLVDTTYEMRM